MKDLKEYCSLFSNEIDTIIDKDKLDSKYKNVKFMFITSYYKMMTYLYRSCPSNGKRRFDGKGRDEGGQGKNRKPFPKYDEFKKSFDDTLDSCKDKKSFAKIMARLALATSIKQLNSSLMESCGVSDEKQIESIHANNIIDNVMLLIPLCLMSQKDPTQVAEALNHSNVIDSLNHKLALTSGIYEKFNKKKMPVQAKKKFKAFLSLYECSKKEIAKYI